VNIDGVDIEPGQQIVVENEDGSYYFRYLGTDGSLTCWGGPSGHGAMRSFRQERCHLPGWRPPVVEEDGTEKTTRASRYSAFELWASTHQNETFTTAQLVEISGFSNATVLKYLATSLIFEQIKRGTWRVRDLSKSRA
jgi:hypothetical protein